MADHQFKKVSTGVIDHFQREIWNPNAQEASLLRRKIDGFSRWVYLVFYGFVTNQCLVRASALTFTTVLAIVPLLAVAFSISKGFDLQNTEFIRDMLLKMSAGREEVADHILGYINNTSVKTLGWLGVVTLLLTVFSTVGTVEKAFNTIWRVRRGRVLWRKFTDFFSVILICPLVILLASSFTVTIQQQEMVQQLLSISAFGVMEALLLKLAPMVLIWIAFIFMYIFIPNTKVRFSSATLGGVVAGTLWQTAQWAYINWQVGVSKYNAIYGSFAQLPLFLMWMYISWVIVLFGAEVAYAFQNVHVYTRRRYAGTATMAERQKIALLMALVVTRGFKKGEPPLPEGLVSDVIGAPAELVSELFDALVAGGLMVAVGAEGERKFVPARTPDTIRVTDVLRVLTGHGDDETALMRSFPVVDEVVATLLRAAEEQPKNANLSDLASRVDFSEPEPGAKPAEGAA